MWAHVWRPTWLASGCRPISRAAYCELGRVFRVAGVTLTELREVVFSMKRSGACGPDDFCIRILLLCFDAISPHPSSCHQLLSSLM